MADQPYVLVVVDGGIADVMSNTTATFLTVDFDNAREDPEYASDCLEETNHLIELVGATEEFIAVRDRLVEYTKTLAEWRAAQVSP